MIRSRPAAACGTSSAASSRWTILPEGSRLSRRAFTGVFAAAFLLAAGACATPQAQQGAVGQQRVSISTPGGNAEALLFTPADGKGPGVVLWADIGGLRPAI